MKGRSYLMDGLRVVSAHVIVLHHLVSYGPLASSLQDTWPGLFHLLYNYGRFATQIFLVMAGYLSAQALLSPRVSPLAERLRKRYVRLMPTFLLAIVSVAVVVTWLRPWINQDWLTEPPTVWQWVSHVMLIQDLVGQPAMTLGAWYVAIDFQLFVLFNVLVWGLVRFGAQREVIPMSLALLCLASQWYFNRDPNWDLWALYFFESYGAGALLAWSLHGSAGVVITARRVLMLCLISALIAGLVFPRPRLLITVAVCALLWWGAHRWQPSGRVACWLQRQSDQSYALFLTHFIPLVVFNALWIVWDGASSAWGVALLALAWMTCVGWSVMFHHSVETLMRKAWRS
jgi:peptidoglycan/LPS O-acetylase OafA/YrhL